MKMFELLPRPLGSIFRKLTHFTCNSPLHLRRRNTANADSKIQLAMGMGDFERRPENAIETKTANAKSGW